MHAPRPSHGNRRVLLVAAALVVALPAVSGFTAVTIGQSIVAVAFIFYWFAMPETAQAPAHG